ncbi:MULTISPECIES: phosphonate metabolism protein PhnP [Pantoea]|jgi:phosphoribosyl 1,2-cyclic phosphate phosphodiesterase|uniref:phosphonate metabolism protein PhnP n=3 Tax=Erwiniaceae TaxID=1903409 RepID=UPI0006609544|nr:MULTISPECIES: phosphonate metabolism protein PhnP [Pantoea]MBS6437347.1 phosphonate metabolism protein PhnP [Pantoea sp.]MDU2729703.1 phosphonate metabolism protein PhnP [Pantoea sp.]MDU5472199.1 phosphonate metabolism protein PhnP [Pantoea sp.]
MKLTFLGTGGVTAAPLFGCDCAACLRARGDAKRRRAPCSALIEAGGERILLDAGLPLLTERFAPGELSRILLTHYHMDHVQGLFALRWGTGEAIPVWGPPDERGCDDLFKHPGLLDFRPSLTPFVPHLFGALQVTPLPLQHSKLTHGYLFDWHGARLAWLCDTCGLPPDTDDFLTGQRIDELVIDCNDPPSPDARNHNDLTRALAIVDRLAPRRAWLTHLSHQMDNWLANNRLPESVSAAADGITLSLSADDPVTV